MPRKKTQDIEKRKVSDVILDMEEKVRYLTGLVTNLDNNTKLILDRLNFIINTKPAEKPTPERTPATKSNIMVAKPMSGNLVDDDYDEYGNPQLTEAIMPGGQRRTSRTQEKPSSKVPVSQRILFPDGQAIVLASVEILRPQQNKDPVLIKQTRTNPKGRWIAALEPGEYIVHIMKRQSADSSKLPVELRFPIQVPSSDEPLELPSPELPDVYK